MFYDCLLDLSKICRHLFYWILRLILGGLDFLAKSSAHLLIRLVHWAIQNVMLHTTFNTVQTFLLKILLSGGKMRQLLIILAVNEAIVPLLDGNK